MRRIGQCVAEEATVGAAQSHSLRDLSALNEKIDQTQNLELDISNRLVRFRPTEQASNQGIQLRNKTFVDIQTSMASFEANAQRSLAQGSPRADLLLTLIQFNVLRALISNSAMLGVGSEWLLPDAESPFSSQTINLTSFFVPKDLRPTITQKKTSHHPWIDLFPIPALRDNILRAGDVLDEDDLCNSLVDFDGLSNDKTGLIVWKEPWDISGWEVSEAFTSKWIWLLRGCDELLASTNSWRALRGEDALQL